MKWLVDMLTSTIGRKLIMALTGLFLILFLTVHLSGNLQLLKDDGGKAFNIYAEFMTTFPLIKVISIGNFFFILLHIYTSIVLTQRNRAARPVQYAYLAGQSTNSSWASRNMGLLGTLILVFLIVHLRGYWYEMHFGGIPTQNYGGKEVKDLYAVVKESYKQWWYVAFYVISMAFVGFHLLHGFQSAFQTLGLSHKKYTPLIKAVGYGFAIIVSLGFALIPMVMFLKG
jgi:succinate dehydrogenase / fumarate reductase cytochrome b subunit